MPLRVRRTDEVTALSLHPNDPAGQAETTESPASDSAGGQFLTKFTLDGPGDASPETMDATNEREANRARDFAEQGHLERLWRLQAWLGGQTTPLTPHPSDPALTCG